MIFNITTASYSDAVNKNWRNMMSSLIDIFNDKYEHIGVEDKKIAHEKGLWHRVFTCVILNSQKSTVYLQRKKNNRYSFKRPDYLDISVGGHYKAGETIEDGIRELFEETGLNKNDVNYNQLISIGIRQTAATVSPNYIANEFQHIYLFDYQGNPENLVKENNETRGFVELKIDDTIDILTYKSNSISGRYYFFDEGKINSEFCNIRITDFIPSYLMTDQFMLRLIIAAKRYIIQTDRTLLFW